MRLNRVDEDARIVELYKHGWSFRRLQDRYHRSPNNIAELVRGIEVTCSSCGKHKGKVRFHSHHPDRVDFPNYTVLLCPSCHAKEEANLRRQKEIKSPPPSGAALPTTENMASKPSTASFWAPPRPLSPTEKKVLTGLGIALVVDALFPGFFGRWRQGIQDHWHKS